MFGGPVAGQDERFGGDGSVGDEAVVVALMIGAAAFSMVLSVNDLVLPSTPPWSLRRRPEPFDDRLGQITWPLLLDFEMTGELLTQVGREVMPNVPALATTTPTAGCCWLRTQARASSRRWAGTASPGQRAEQSERAQDHSRTQRLAPAAPDPMAPGSERLPADRGRRPPETKVQPHRCREQRLGRCRRRLKAGPAPGAPERKERIR